MKKTILLISLFFGASILAYAEPAVTTAPVSNAVTPPVVPDVNATMPQPAPTETTPPINKTEDGSGDDADTLNDPDPEADNQDDGVTDVGEAPAQKS